MINKIRAYLDHIFRDIPETKKSRDLKDELFANLVEKYTDQLSAGKSEEQAYQAAIAGIGDIKELVVSLHSMDASDPIQGDASPSEEARVKKAGLVAVGVACIVASPIPAALFSVLRLNTLGFCFMIGTVAFGVGLIVYANMTAPKYIRTDDSVVEDFKEWRSHNKNKAAAYRSFHSAFWAFVVCIYLIISFSTFNWHFTWIIFIIAAAVSRIITGFAHLSGINDQKEDHHDKKKRSV